MRTAGIRELKNRLSEYVRCVRRGERVLITDRGKVVAELRRPDAAEAPRSPDLEALARRGARIGAPNQPGLYVKLPSLMPGGSAARLLDEERGPR